MIGYLCGYLRYYYPLEFITAYLNNAGNNDDIINGTMLAQLKNITIKTPRFRHSIDKYTMDKETNTIYKGLNSVKDLKKFVSSLLYSIKDEQFESFYAFLNRCEQIKIGNANLLILIKLNFFEEFGTVTKLLKYFKIYEQLHNNKQFNIDKQYIVKTSAIKKYCKTQTKKLYKDFDEKSFFYDLWKVMPNDNNINLLLMQSELQYYNYIETIDKDGKDNIYICTSNEQRGKSQNRLLSLYNTKTGENYKVKLSQKLYRENKFNVGDILYIKYFTKKGIWGKTPDGKWSQSSTQFEDYLTDWEMVCLHE